ncbi:unnamed protein product [Arabis nemorensis]|uniref:SGNH hydrolase-type esterase domain-containing protein n=1 Tax=Arabis nemorensis TaxID=586526 RepID=A0A565CH48_9BRAS|nr:unnamed protein product [Arabis nemorensis]
MKLFDSLLLFFFSSLLLGEINGAEISNQNHDLNGTKRLFVFGDSYADTGNKKKNKSQPGAWSYPYGITFLSHPFGRFSHGHISIDFLGISLSIKLFAF